MADGKKGWSGDKKGGCMRKEAILLGEIVSKEKSTVKGRWTNLMFTQRNNPYCDLLKISDANIYFFINSSKLFLIFYIFAQNNQIYQ